VRASCFDALARAAASLPEPAKETDQTMQNQASEKPAPQHPAGYLVDSYLDWARNEGPPIHEEFGVDLLSVDMGPWPRLGDRCKGAFIHLKGRGDWLTIFLLEIPPGGKSAPQRHIYDDVFYVLSGNGTAVVEAADGTERMFEWGPRSLFVPPLNARCTLFNASGREPVRIASTNDMPLLMNIFRSEAFIFDNPIGFPERIGSGGFYAGEGELTSIRPGRNLWETNFVADLGGFELMPWEDRGAGSRNMQYLLGGGSIGAHTSEMPAGAYKKGHRHGPGAHVFAVTGTGFSLLWYENDKEFIRQEWKHGYVYAPPDGMFHQHFNTCPDPARYLAIMFGTKRYPIVQERRAGSEGRRTDVSIKEGGCQIEYQDQDARIHPMWLKEIKTAGVESKMGKYFDESK
jgi:hypothetical protein